MRIFTMVNEYKRNKFRRLFSKYYSLNPSGQKWSAMIDVINHVADREEFRHSFNLSEMVLMLREWCIEAGLQREDRREMPYTLEGYFGFELK